jgi:energy-coupling factor transporter ATP-binding protein EcfA2
MKLTNATARWFRNILDSSAVEIDDKVTAIVGKNESGKTSFLTALARLNPARPVGKFDVHADYPAWLEKKHRHAGYVLPDVKPIEVTFTVTDEDRQAWDGALGSGVIRAAQITASRSYADKYVVSGHDPDEGAAVVHVVRSAAVTPEAAPSAHAAASFAELQTAVQQMKGSGDAAAAATAASLEKAVTAYLRGKTLAQLAHEAVAARIPKFFYFANYSSIPKQIKIRDLLHRAKSNLAGLSDDERTAVSLLRQAATDDEYLLNADYELRKRELENVANAITDDVLGYWTQNPDLRVLIDITPVIEGQAPNQQVVPDELKVRVWDDRHRLSLGFGGRSSGFQWFFSFLAAFAEYEASRDPLIILLDEPALGLHARAQSDFLRFIDERLAPKHQVVYTTHSPFMVPPGQLERVRVVEDAGRDRGSVISSNVLTKDPDTIFPLQGALGYDLAQHLFVGPDNLVVEGTSDFTYLTTLSDHLASVLGGAPADGNKGAIGPAA